MTKRLKQFEVSQPWDRNTNRMTGEAFEGNVDIIVEGAILSPSGKAVGFLEPIAFEDIPVIPIDCSDGRVCPDGATCLFGLCVPDNAPVPRFCDDESDCPPALTCTFGICLSF